LHADCYVRLDFNGPAVPGRGAVIKTVYGQIKNLFSHSLYKGGPSHIVANVEWYDNKGTHPLSGLPLVSKTNDDEDNFTKLTFMRECYPRPLAIWPHDPLDELRADDPAKNYFRVIDRNETSAA
jgi:hypothetical protein